MWRRKASLFKNGAFFIWSTVISEYLYMLFVTINGYIWGAGAVGMGDQYWELGPCLHLGPISVLVSGVRSIFELCLFYCCWRDGEAG